MLAALSSLIEVKSRYTLEMSPTSSLAVDCSVGVDVGCGLILGRTGTNAGTAGTYVTARVPAFITRQHGLFDSAHTHDTQFPPLHPLYSYN